MGGARETFVQNKSSKHNISIGNNNKIRIHESNGEVHFHDDANNLKVAIPIDQFWKHWNDFEASNIGQNGFVLHFVDIKNSTVAIIESISSISNDRFVVDAIISIKPAIIDKNITKISEFVAGR